MVLGRKTNFFPRKNKKKTKKNIFWETMRPNSKKMFFWFSPRKKLVFSAQNHFILRKKLVFLPKTIFLLGKSWFFAQNHLFPREKPKKTIFLESGPIVSQKMVFFGFFLVFPRKKLVFCAKPSFS